jgi:lipoprotein-releasing system permease protein
MRAEAKLALKYFRLRRKSVVRWTSMIARIALALGVAVMIIAQGLSRGFAEEITQKILLNSPHINVFHKSGNEIKDWEKLKTKIENIRNVVSVEAINYKEAIVIGKDKISYCVVQARSDVNRTAIGKELAKKIQVSNGDTIELILFDENQIKKLEIRVDEIIQTELYNYDSTWIFVTPEVLGELLGKKQFFPNVLKVSVKDVYSSNETAEKIKNDLGEEFEVLDWQKANQLLFNALALERKVTFLIVSLLVLIASTNITATLSLLVNERRLDIAVLKAVGVRTKSLALIFLFEGVMLATTGIIGGFVLGLIMCFTVNHFELISLQKEIYTVSNISLRLSLFDIGLILISAFLLSLISTVYPAFHASRMKPAEILRNL